MVLQRLQFFLLYVEKMILYQILVGLSERLFPPMTLCASLVGKLTYVNSDCSLTFLHEDPIKNRQINRKVSTFPDPVENSSAIPGMIYKTVPLMSNKHVISFWTRDVCGTWFQQLLSHSATQMIETPSPISTLNQELTNLEQTLTRCSLHYERWTVKGKDCASALK